MEAKNQEQNQEQGQEQKRHKRFGDWNKSNQTSENDLKKVDLLVDAISAANTQRVVPETIMEEQTERVGAGRPKIQRRVERGKAMNVYFDPDTHQLLKNMKFFHDIEMKDIPYLLTREFFKKYEIGGKLNEDGLAYIKKLLEEVN